MGSRTMTVTLYEWAGGMEAIDALALASFAREHVGPAVIPASLAYVAWGTRLATGSSQPGA